MLLYVRANAREVELHWDAERLEYGAVSNTAQLEDLGRLDRAAQT